MSGQQNARKNRPPGRRNPTPKAAHRRNRSEKLRSARVEAELLTLVRAGVEKFILKGASVAEFLKTIRALTDQENKYSHQLTRSVFTKILKEAVRKRNLRRSK